MEVTTSSRGPHRSELDTLCELRSTQAPGPRRGSTALGWLRLRLPLATRAPGTTLVVVAALEFAGELVVVVVALVVVGALVVVVTSVVVVGIVVRGAVLVVVLTRDVVLVVLVEGCRGRELRVKTSTSKSRGLDHISRCEVRRVNRRAMVIED